MKLKTIQYKVFFEILLQRNDQNIFKKGQGLDFLFPM